MNIGEFAMEFSIELYKIVIQVQLIIYDISVEY